jgi:hypothetical protein
LRVASIAMRLLPRPPPLPSADRSYGQAGGALCPERCDAFAPCG